MIKPQTYDDQQIAEAHIMTVTAIGVVIIVLSLVALCLGRRWLWMLLIVSLPLQAAAVVTFESGGRETGLNPRFFIMLLVCPISLTQLIRRRQSSIAESAYNRVLWNCILPALAVLAWALLSAAVLPLMLEGVATVHPYAIDKLAPLTRSASNFRHSAYLVLCVLSFCLLAIEVSTLAEASRRMLAKALEVSSWGAIVLVIWHMLYFYLGVPFPVKFLLSNPGAALNETGQVRPELGYRSDFVRPSGSFSEPSYASLYVAGCFAYNMWLYLRRRSLSALRGVAVLVTVVMTVVLTSTTGYFAVVFLAVGFGGGVLLNFTRGRGRGTAFRFAGVAFVLGILLLVTLLTVPRLQEDVATLYDLMVRDKIATDAGGRLEHEFFAYRVFFETYGIGAGLGSNEAFSLGSYVVSNLGSLGVILLLWFAYRLFKAQRSGASVSPNSLAAVWPFTIGLVLAGLIGVEIMIEPSVWVLLGLALGGTVAAYNDANRCGGCRVQIDIADDEVIKVSAYSVTRGTL